MFAASKYIGLTTGSTMNNEAHLQNNPFFPEKSQASTSLIISHNLLCQCAKGTADFQQD